MNLLCRNWGWKKTRVAWSHSALYVTLTDVKRHEQKSEISERTYRSNGLRGLEFCGLSKPWLDDSHENVQSDGTLVGL
jgi:hypothetical protein